MSLSSQSNTINALGIFGRLAPNQEKYFSELEATYSRRPANHKDNVIFNHLSLVISNDVPVGRLPAHIDLLRELKQYLPLSIKTSDVIIKDGTHCALCFDVAQTKEIRDLAAKFVPDGVVTTDYTKVVWFVPGDNQAEVINELQKVKEMTFFDFILVANRQDDENTIYSSNKYK